MTQDTITFGYVQGYEKSSKETAHLVNKIMNEKTTVEQVVEVLNQIIAHLYLQHEKVVTMKAIVNKRCDEAPDIFNKELDCDEDFTCDECSGGSSTQIKLTLIKGNKKEEK